MKLMQNLAFTLAIVLLGSTLAQAAWGSSWETKEDKESMLSRRSVETTEKPAETEDVQGRNFGSNEPIYSNDTEIDSIIDQVLNSRREGRNLGEYDQIYADGNVEQALQQGNDVQARNLIREKLCGLGLMSCEVEEKRPFYSSIYAQGPPPPNYGGGPYGPPRPMPPNNFNSRPPPPNSFGPPPPQNSFGPPRKVGYEGPFKPNYNGPSNGPSYNGPYLEHPPPSSDITYSKPPPGAIIYGSKPPGPVYAGNSAPPPYAFEKPATDKLQSAGSQQNNFYSHQSSASSSASSSSSKFVVSGVEPLSKVDIGAPGLQQHVHHHYHHVEGGDTAKVPSVPIPISSSQTINTDFSALAQSSTAFTPEIQTGFSQSPAYTAGFNGASQGGLLSQSYKPNGDIYKPSAGLGSFGSGSNGFQQESGANNFGSNSFGVQVSGSYHTQNPDYYKKELQNFGGIGSSSNNIDSGFGANKYQGGYETARQQFVDCQCVPFNQCPAADRIGRKEDLILPIDPRNLGKDIEALADDASNSTTIAPETETETKKDDEQSKRSKRQAEAEAEAEDKQDVEPLPLDAEGFRQGFAALQAIAHLKRKILPTYGVSFGLPYPSAGAYPTNPYGNIPAQNPHFGSIGPNGLSLGLVNVNPLVSVQVSKTEFGNKVLKPYVNLHVTPNANLLQTVGDFFKRKPEVVHNTHYHHHDHHGLHGHHDLHSHDFIDHGSFGEHFSPPEYAPLVETIPIKPAFEYHSAAAGPPISSISPISSFPEHYQHQHSAGHHFESSSYSSFAEGGANFYQHGYEPTLGGGNEFSTINAGGIDQLNANFGGTEFGAGGFGGDWNGGNNFFERSSNANNTQLTASKYSELPIESTRSGKSLNLGAYKPIPTPAPGLAEGSQHITFPRDRRRRDVIEHEESAELKKSFVVAEERAYYGNRPVEKTCRANEVCCRRPLPPPPQQQLGRCGTRNAAGITGRIKNPVYVDGDSEFGEYPWHVAILKKDPKESIYACGGTLIDAQHIITAAHCIKSQNGFDLRARLGEWDVNHDVEFFPYIERDVVSVHIHPEYYAGTLDNDLAVLKLDFPVDFTKNPHISPACLPDKFSDYTGARCWTTGWGKDAFGQQGKYQNILKEVDVPILSQHQCESQLRQTRLGYSYKLNPGFVCAGGEEGKDACKGDGGGPLVCERNGIWNVVGVVSWGIGCGEVNVPGVYVRVSHYLDWINQITQYYK